MTASNSKILRARESGNPVIDGSEVTFFWEGRTAATLVGDFDHWDSSATPFKRLSPRPSTPLRTSLQPASAKSVWYCTLSLPRDAYVEYAFHDPVSQKNFTDPLNKKSISNGVGGRNNFFYMHETMPSPFAMRRGALGSRVLRMAPAPASQSAGRMRPRHPRSRRPKLPRAPSADHHR